VRSCRHYIVLIAAADSAEHLIEWYSSYILYYSLVVLFMCTVTTYILYSIKYPLGFLGILSPILFEGVFMAYNIFPTSKMIKKKNIEKVVGVISSFKII